ncbi:MAG: histidine phosphatase family protein [Firmicutes bacterium]|nr:histidine phosphatase family protein [Bacillota bacterium]
MIKLFLTRHGQTQWNEEGRLQGSKDSNLTSLGIKQAELLKERLADERIDIIYSSPLIRAYKTAEVISSNRDLDIITDKNFKEINFGDWEGLKHDEITSPQYEIFWNKPHLYKPSTGESFKDFKKRILSSLNNIIKNHDNKNVLIVAHAVVVKQILNYFENRPLEKFWDPPFMHSTNLSLIEIEDENVAEIKLYADTSHLETLKAANS